MDTYPSCFTEVEPQHSFCNECGAELDELMEDVEPLPNKPHGRFKLIIKWVWVWVWAFVGGYLLAAFSAVVVILPLAGLEEFYSQVWPVSGAEESLHALRTYVLPIVFSGALVYWVSRITPSHRIIVAIGLVVYSTLRRVSLVFFYGFGSILTPIAALMWVLMTPAELFAFYLRYREEKQATNEPLDYITVDNQAAEQVSKV